MHLENKYYINLTEYAQTGVSNCDEAKMCDDQVEKAGLLEMDAVCVYGKYNRTGISE